MDEILDLAEKLGNLVRNDNRFRALMEAEKKVVADAEAKKLLEDFQTQSEKIMDRERRREPVEVEDKHRLRDLHEKVAGHALIKELTKARVEYAELMNRVNRAIFGREEE